MKSKSEPACFSVPVRRELVAQVEELIKTKTPLLDGKPGRILGFNNRFATVGFKDYAKDGSLTAEYPWETVVAILNGDCQFRST